MRWLRPISTFRRRLCQTRQGRWVWRGLVVIALLYILADFLAQDKPLLAQYQGKVYAPVALEYLVDWGWRSWPDGLARLDWHTAEVDWAAWPLIPYDARYQDVENASVSPFESQQLSHWSNRHWLGTDELGRDLLAALIHAVRIDITVGLLAMMLAGILGLLLGSAAGFWGDHKWRLSRASVVGAVIGLWPAWFYGFSVRQWTLQQALQSHVFAFLGHLLLSLLLFSALWLGCIFLFRWLAKGSWWRQPVSIPLDLVVSRLIEVTVSIPVLFLILLILSLTQEGSLLWVMLVIGFTRWTGIARLVRGELLRIRQLDYLAAGESMGFRERYLLLQHALPNAMGPVSIALAFGIANAILIEGFLSFIGLGLPPDVPTWGSLLNLGRENVHDWWLALFPGLALFATVTLFNLLGASLQEGKSR